MSNAQVIQGVYEAFGRGDIGAILSCFSEDISWDAGLADSGVPWMRPRSGRDAVAGFFQELAALEFFKFQPKAILESGDTVVALIDVGFTVKANGRRVEEDDEVHIFRFGSDGLISSFAHKVDTYGQWAAFNGV